MKDRLITFYMGLAHQCSAMSRAKRLHVGAVIVKDDNIISFSWNGTPSGWDNECEDEYLYEDGVAQLVTKPEVLHAESNSISKLAKSPNSGLGASLFCTHQPCLDCAKLVYQAGISSVYYEEEYRNNDGIEFLKKCNIEITHVKKDRGRSPAEVYNDI